MKKKSSLRDPDEIEIRSKPGTDFEKWFFLYTFAPKFLK